MILAAGLGTRLKPFTDEHPKALYPINGKPILQINIEYLQSFGITDVIINVHHFALQIINELLKNKGWGSTITISDETKQVLETGGGLKKAASFFKDSSEPFVLINADILTDVDISKMVIQHIKYNCIATLAVTNRATSRYLLFDNNDKLCGWVNEKTGEQKGKAGIKKAFSGIHIISPSIFPFMLADAKFSMIDLYLHLAQTQPIGMYDHTNGLLIDIGKPDTAALAEAWYANKK